MSIKTQFKTDIVKRYRNGESCYQIAKDEGCSHMTVFRELKRKGIYTRKRFWAKEEIEKLKKLYPNTSNKELLKEFPNRSEKSIISMAKKLCLKKKAFKKICKNCGKEFEVKSKPSREICIICMKKRWEHNNLKSARERRKRWLQRHPQYLREYTKRPEVRKRIYQHVLKYTMERIREDPKFRLDLNMRSLIRQSLKGKKAGRGWEKLVGYTLEDLVKHLEKQFDDKMSWENYGSYWHIDHIKPRSLFKYTSPDDPEFKECWSLKNLQPLEKTANLKKRNIFLPNSSYI